MSKILDQLKQLSEKIDKMTPEEVKILFSHSPELDAELYLNPKTLLFIGD